MRKKFLKQKELTNHAMQQAKNKTVKEKIPEPKQGQSRDAAGKGSPVEEKIPQLGRADQSRDAAGKGSKVEEKIPQPKQGQSRDAAGKAVGVNGRYVSEEVQGRLCAKVHVPKRKQLDKQ